MSDQGKLFDDDPTPWDMDDAAERLVASVVFTDGPDQDFSYLVPERMAGQLEPGQRVRATLGRGNRPAIGYCVRLETREIGPRRLKVLDPFLRLSRVPLPRILRVQHHHGAHHRGDRSQVGQSDLPLDLGTRQPM